LVLIAGPTGSGKTCTLTALVDFINDTRKEHIITIEDPIEFLHENKKSRVNQRELGDHTDSYAQALAASMREDPDVIVLSNLPDSDTMRDAIGTAESGQLVFATLCSTDSVSAIERIIDSFPTNMQPGIRSKLARTLKGMVVQHLCRCKSGKGRVAVREVLIINDEIAGAIRDGRTNEIPALMQQGAKDNTVLLNDALVKLVLNEQISAEEALETAVDATDLLKKLRVAGIELEE
jgi:twitching motility protein PilT